MTERIIKQISLLCFFLVFIINESPAALPRIEKSEGLSARKSQKLIVKPFNGAAQWIWTSTRTRQPKDHVDTYRVAYFRRTFTVPFDNATLTIHVSADSRYILWCNGQFVGRGPGRYL